MVPITKRQAKITALTQTTFSNMVKLGRTV